MVFAPNHPSNYSLVNIFGPDVNEAEIQSFCIDANVELTPSPPPPDQPVKDDTPGNLFPVIIPNNPFPAIVPNHFPAPIPLSVEVCMKSDQKHQAFLPANSFTSLVTHLSKASMSHDFSQPSTSGTAIDDPDYNIPADDENDSQCPSGLDSSDVPNEEDHEIVTGSGKAWQHAGHIPDVTWKKLKSAFLKLDVDIDQLATDTGLVFKGLVHRTEKKTEIGLN